MKEVSVIWHTFTSFNIIVFSRPNWTAIIMIMPKAQYHQYTDIIITAHRICELMPRL